METHVIIIRSAASAVNIWIRKYVKHTEQQTGAQYGCDRHANTKFQQTFSILHLGRSHYITYIICTFGVENYLWCWYINDATKCNCDCNWIISVILHHVVMVRNKFSQLRIINQNSIFINDVMKKFISTLVRRRFFCL